MNATFQDGLYKRSIHMVAFASRTLKRKDLPRGWKYTSEGEADGLWGLITFHACHEPFEETLFSLRVELYFTVPVI